MLGLGWGRWSFSESYIDPNLLMFILIDSKLVIFSPSTTCIFITFSYKRKSCRVSFWNSCKVRGCKNRNWRWMFAFDRCDGKIWFEVQKYRTSCWITHALRSNEWPKTSDPRSSENQAKASERSNMCGFDKEKIYFLILYMCVLYHDRDVWCASDEKIRLACHALHVLYMSIRIKTCRSIWGNNYEII